MPQLITDVTERAKRELDANKQPHSSRPNVATRSIAGGLPPRRPDTRLPLRVRVEKNRDGPGGFIKVEYVNGRASWIESIYSNLTGPARHLTEHRWSILRPNRGSEWFTGDHPVVRLNYSSDEDYNFGGGWGSKGSELFLALSPQHLMYTKVGDQSSQDATLTHEMTMGFQRLIAERSSRWIVARGQPRRAEWFKPRKVHMSLFNDEESARRKWHETQSAAEQWED